MTVFSFTLDEFMAGWLRVAQRVEDGFSETFDIEGLELTIHSISVEEGPLVATAEQLADFGSLLMEGDESIFVWLQQALARDETIHDHLVFFVWAFRRERRDELPDEELLALRRSALVNWGESIAESLAQRIEQVVHAEEMRDFRRAHAQMSEPDNVALSRRRFGPVTLDLPTRLAGRELAQRLIATLRERLKSEQFKIVADWVRSSATDTLGTLAQGVGVSPSTATRARQVLYSLLAFQKERLDRTTFCSMVRMLPAAFEEVA